ncbi:MAG: hypothetical protein WDZ28_03650 [Simkaniaceae bacterium]
MVRRIDSGHVERSQEPQPQNEAMKKTAKKIHFQSPKLHSLHPLSERAITQGPVIEDKKHNQYYANLKMRKVS